MKKILSVLLLAAMVVTMASCAEDEAASTTTAATTTTGGAPTVTTFAPIVVTTDPDEIPETPYLYENADTTKELATLLEGKTEIHDKIDMESLFASAGYGTWNETTENVPQMFDGVRNEAEFTEAGQGKIGGTIDSNTGAYFYWSLTEKAKLSAYVLWTGNDNATYTGRNPVAWTIWATNDASALEDEEFDASKWSKLDYVWDGGIVDANFTPNGYAIDEANQGEYQYYAWHIEYTKSNTFQACELDLYVG